MAQPLPSLAEAIKSGLLPTSYANARSAYNSILSVEKEARDNKRLVRVRTLGYFLLYPMSSAARDSVVSDVLACEKEKDPVPSLDDLGDHYVHTLLTFCERRPAPSTGRYSSIPA